MTEQLTGQVFQQTSKFKENSMPLGAFRINSLSRYIAPGGVGGSTRTPLTLYTENGAASSSSQFNVGTGSIFLDGTDDYVALDSTDNSKFALDDFTMEMWGYQTSNSGYRALITNWEHGFFFAVVNGNQLVMYINATLVVNATGLTITSNSWNHFAVTRNGSNVKIFLNGTQVGSTGTFGTQINPTDFTGIGVNVNNYPGGNLGSFWAGYLDEIRVSDISRYDSNFTTTTTAFTNDDNTVLLIHGDTDIKDDGGDRSAVVLTAYNDVEISTDNSKFGGSSMYSPGGTQMASADYIEGTLNHDIGTGDFTVEWWTKWETTGATNMFSLTDTSLNVGFEMRLDNPANWRFYEHANGGSTFNLVLQSSNQIYAYQANWNHFAWVRSGTTITVYVNGVAAATTGTYSTDLRDATVLHVGAGIKTGYASMVGYMDEVRVSNIARYTSNFTPSTSEFANDQNTLFLLHANGTDTSTDFIDDNT